MHANSAAILASFIEEASELVPLALCVLEREGQQEAAHSSTKDDLRYSAEVADSDSERIVQLKRSIHRDSYGIRQRLSIVLKDQLQSVCLVFASEVTAQDFQELKLCEIQFPHSAFSLSSPDHHILYPKIHSLMKNVLENMDYILRDAVYWRDKPLLGPIVACLERLMVSSPRSQLQHSDKKEPDTLICSTEDTMVASSAPAVAPLE